MRNAMKGLLLLVFFASTSASPKHLACDRSISVGSVIMSEPAVPGVGVVELSRNGTNLGCEGAIVRPGEKLQIATSDVAGKYMLEVDGIGVGLGDAGFAEGMCDMRRSMSKTEVIAPRCGGFVVRAGYAKGHGAVSITEDCPYMVSGFAESSQQLVEEAARCGEIIDSHLHLGAWWSTADELLQELDCASVSRGVLDAVYSKFAEDEDPNEKVSRIAMASDGRVYGLASLNTTGDWSKEKAFELNRLSTFLERPEFVGTKLAPPHTCLALDSPILHDVVETIAASSKRVLGIHVGTTPLCSLPEGAEYEACCEARYVDPTLLEPLIEHFSSVTFVLLHSGFDFLDEGHALNFHGSLVDAAIALARKYSNVVLEISALHAQTATGELKYPGGDEAVQKMYDAGVADRVMWASDGNHLPGMMAPSLEAGVAALIAAGFSEDQRCAALRGTPARLFFAEGAHSPPPQPSTTLPESGGSGGAGPAVGVMLGLGAALGAAYLALRLRQQRQEYQQEMQPMELQDEAPSPRKV